MSRVFLARADGLSDHDFGRGTPCESEREYGRQTRVIRAFSLLSLLDYQITPVAEIRPKATSERGGRLKAERPVAMERKPKVRPGVNSD